MGLVDMTPNLYTAEGFLWASDMVSDPTVSNCRCPTFLAGMEASEKSIISVRQLLQSSTSAVLNAHLTINLTPSNIMFCDPLNFLLGAVTAGLAFILM